MDAVCRDDLVRAGAGDDALVGVLVRTGEEVGSGVPPREETPGAGAFFAVAADMAIAASGLVCFVGDVDNAGLDVRCLDGEEELGSNLYDFPF